MTKINGNIIQDNLRTELLSKVSKVFENKQSVNFGSKIHEALKEVAESQMKSNKITKDYELGKENDLTKVMINQQVSSLGFQLTLNIRNKVMTAYKDIMNMPV